jgi:hypothetical protein
MNGMLELYVEPPGVLTQAPSDKPRASLVARYLRLNWAWRGRTSIS